MSSRSLPSVSALQLAAVSRLYERRVRSGAFDESWVVAEVRRIGSEMKELLSTLSQRNSDGVGEYDQLVAEVDAFLAVVACNPSTALIPIMTGSARRNGLSAAPSFSAIADEKALSKLVREIFRVAAIFLLFTRGKKVKETLREMPGRFKSDHAGEGDWQVGFALQQASGFLRHFDGGTQALLRALNSESGTIPIARASFPDYLRAQASGLPDLVKSALGEDFPTLVNTVNLVSSDRVKLVVGRSNKRRSRIPMEFRSDIPEPLDIAEPVGVRM